MAGVDSADKFDDRSWRLGLGEKDVGSDHAKRSSGLRLPQASRSVIDSDAVIIAVGGVLAVILLVILLFPHAPYFLWALVA